MQRWILALVFLAHDCNTEAASRVRSGGPSAAPSMAGPHNTGHEGTAPRSIKFVKLRVPAGGAAAPVREQLCVSIEDL